MKINRFGKAEVLSTAELDLLLSVLPENHRVLATLLRRTAARVSEGLQLKWQYVGKTVLSLPHQPQKGRRKLGLFQSIQILLISFQAGGILLRH